ncbi:hypothetical protein GF324_00230, partial [bacterium]|nr:hypothetical protein [bacterium]
MWDRIDNNPGVGGVGPKGIDPTQPGSPQDEARKAEEAKRPAEGKDKAHISSDAAEISRYQEMVKMHREAYGESERADKLAQVKQRIADGFYDSDEAIDAMAEKVVEGARGDAGRADDLDTVR